MVNLKLSSVTFYLTEEAQKMINWGSFRVNNILVQSPLEKLDPAKHILKGRFTVLRIGMLQTPLVAALILSHYLPSLQGRVVTT